MRPDTLFGLEEHMAKLNCKANPLARLAETIDFECFREPLERGLGYGDRPQGGRPPFDAVMMFKILILQTRENASDEKTELWVRERLTWMQFLGLYIGAPTPDENTIRHFRNRLTEAAILDDLMARFQQLSHDLDYADETGRMLDASVVECPKQHNTAAENAAIKAGQSAREIWPKEPNKAAQKDTDARWTGKKSGQKVKYRRGFKINIRAGVDTKFVRAAEVTAANTHDGHYMDVLIEGGAPFMQQTDDGVVEEAVGIGAEAVVIEAEASGMDEATLAIGEADSDSDEKVVDIYADGAYNSKANRAFLKKKRLRSRMIVRRQKGEPMPEAVARENAKRSSVRARVEHVFAHMKNCYGLFIRTIGLARATTKLKLVCLAYNFDRLVFLERRRRCRGESA